MSNNTSRIGPGPLHPKALIGRHPAAVRARIEAMEHLLEGLITIPGINRKIGLDVMLNAVPGIGPTIAAAMGAWMLWEARNLGMSRLHVARMAGNVGLDYLLGLVPIIGIIPDFLFRSNSRNLKMIKRFMDKKHPSTVIVDR